MSKSSKGHKNIGSGIEFITVLGRRIVLRPIDGHRERQMLRDGKNVADPILPTKNLLQSSLVSANSPIGDFDHLDIGEETDMLLCLHLASFGPLHEFRAICPDAHSHEYKVDLRTVRRELLRCGDADCPCHALWEKHCQEDGFDTTWIHDEAGKDREVLTADWSEIPADHLQLRPPDFTRVLPLSGSKVTFGFHRVLDKPLLAKLARTNDEELIDQSTAKLIRSLDGETRPGNIMRAVEDDLDPFDKGWLRGIVDEISPGIDAGVVVKCKTCSTNFPTNVPIDSSFFIQSSAVFPTWFLALRRSLSETGTSPSRISWAGRSKNAVASLSDVKSTSAK